MIKIQNSSAKINANIKIGIQGSSSPIVGKYFYTANSNNDRDKWWNLQSWWSNSSHTIQATTLPTSATDVIVLGTVAPIVDLDANYWVQPNSINSGTAGIVFQSSLSANVSCDITGDATFNGNSTYNK